MKHLWLMQVAIIASLTQGCSSYILSQAKNFPHQKVDIHDIGPAYIKDKSVYSDMGVIGKDTGTTADIVYHLFMEDIDNSTKIIRPVGAEPAVPYSPFSRPEGTYHYLREIRKKDIAMMNDNYEEQAVCFSEELNEIFEQLNSYEIYKSGTSHVTASNYYLKFCNALTPSIIISSKNADDGRVSRILLKLDETSHLQYVHKGKPWLYPLLIVTVPLDVALATVVVIMKAFGG